MLPVMKEIKAREVMTRDVTTVPQDLPVDQLIALIRGRRYSGFPVVDETGRAVGLISQNDVLRALAFAVDKDDLPPGFQAGKRRAATHLLEAAPAAELGGAAVARLLGRRVRDLMTASVVSCKADTPADDVCEAMIEKRIHRVVVVDDEGKVVGLIAALDLVKRFGEEMRRR